MNIKDKWSHLKVISKIANEWLHRPEAEKELSYLLDRVPSKEHVDRFNFGYFPPNKNSFTEFMDEFGSITKENPTDVFEELNIVYPYYSKKKSFFQNNTLLIPFYDVYGNVLSFSGRTLCGKEEQKEKKISKYKHLSFEKRYHLFGLNESYKNIIKKDSVIIVEGQFDFYSSFISGLNNCVALCGSKLTFQQVILLMRFTNNFYVLLDEDEAGESGRDRINKYAKKYDMNVTRLKVPGNKDIDDFIKESRWKISMSDLVE